MLSIIVCVAQNGAIGNKGKLLYHLRADLQQFKALTTGHTIIMGHRTQQSLPKGSLPNRRNIVLSHGTPDIPRAEVCRSLPEALNLCSGEEEVFVIGGASVYKEALPLADRLYLTEVYDTPKEADTFFPVIDKSQWRELARQHHEADEQNDRPFDFVTLERRREATTSI